MLIGKGLTLFEAGYFATYSRQGRPPLEILNHPTPKDSAHVYRPVFQAESEFRISRMFRRHLQEAGALRHQEPHDHQQEITSSILVILGQYTW